MPTPTVSFIQSRAVAASSLFVSFFNQTFLLLLGVEVDVCSERWQSDLPTHKRHFQVLRGQESFRHVTDLAKSISIQANASSCT